MMAIIGNFEEIEFFVGQKHLYKDWNRKLEKLIQMMKTSQGKIALLVEKGSNVNLPADADVS